MPRITMMHRKKYKQTKTASEKTGFGCSENDYATNPPIDTIEKKLEHMCVYFSWLDALYGERQNIYLANSVEIQDEETISSPTHKESYNTSDDDLENSKNEHKSTSKVSSLEDLNNKNKQLARAVSKSEVATDSPTKSRKADFSLQYTASVKEQMEFQKICLQFEEKSKAEGMELKRQEVEGNLHIKHKEMKLKEKEVQICMDELEENKVTKLKVKKGMMIEKLAASEKSVDKIKEYLALFNVL
ncbi:hypothetical protein HK096_000597 [Nowakowskiella sp. JEL0078]|nr:hypothetical protein HK096_000597 [Nowakowskiella sp. JEL0078]